MNLKRFLSISLLSFSALWMTAGDDIAGFWRYQGDNQRLMAGPDSPTRVVLMGNSITDYWMRDRPSFFTANDLVCRGISGQTTYQFLMRFREDVVNLRPVAVVINGGTNDVAENMYSYNADRTFGNLVSMAQLAAANGITPIMASVLPADHFYWNPSIASVADKIADLNKRIRKYADENNLPYVDYYSAMVSGPTRALNPAYTSDGVHPNAEGYKVMEAILLPVVRAVTGATEDRPEDKPGTNGDHDASIVPPSVRVDGSTVTALSDTVIYTTTGAHVATLNAGATLNPAAGIYIAATSDGSTKFAIR